MEKNKKSDKKFSLGLFLGGLIGAAIIFILGTKEGKKLAENFVEKTEDFEKDLEVRVKKLRSKGEDLIKDAENIKIKLEKRIQEGKQTTSSILVSKIGESLKKLEEVQRKGISLTQELRDKYLKS